MGFEISYKDAPETAFLDHDSTAHNSYRIMNRARRLSLLVYHAVHKRSGGNIYIGSSLTYDSMNDKREMIDCFPELSPV